MDFQTSKLQRKELTDFKHIEIITLSKEGYSIHKISEKLTIPKSTIQDTLSYYKKTNNIQYTSRSGRPTLLNTEAIQQLQNIIKTNPKSTAKEIQQELAQKNINISIRTLRTSLHKIGLYSRIAARKPLLTKIQQENRFNWCIQHSNWTMEEWNQVIWSDELKFNHFSDGPQRV